MYIYIYIYVYICIYIHVYITGVWTHLRGQPGRRQQKPRSVPSSPVAVSLCLGLRLWIRNQALDRGLAMD